MRVTGSTFPCAAFHVDVDTNTTTLEQVMTKAGGVLAQQAAAANVSLAGTGLYSSLHDFASVPAKQAIESRFVNLKVPLKHAGVGHMGTLYVAIAEQMDAAAAEIK